MEEKEHSFARDTSRTQLHEQNNSSNNSAGAGGSNSSSDGGSTGDEAKYKVYKIRWFLLTTLVILNISNAIVSCGFLVRVLGERF